MNPILLVNAKEFAVSKIGHHQRLLEEKNHHGSWSFLKFIYNLSLHLLKNYH